MPKAKLTRVRSFVKRALRAPLLDHIGDPIELPNVVAVKSLDDAMVEFGKTTWNHVIARMWNFTRAQQIVAFGQDWFQEQQGGEWKLVEAEVKPLYKRVDSFWRKHKLPTKHKEYARSFFKMIALDYAYESAVTQAFGKIYLEPVLMAGHFPCGWKGRLPSEAIKRSDIGFAITQRHAARTLREVFGDGKLLAY